MSSTGSCFWNSWDIYIYTLGYYILYIKIYIYIVEFAVLEVWNPDSRQVEILRTAIRSGINFIDNAEVYGAFPGESESIMGQACLEHCQLCIVADEVFPWWVEIDPTNQSHQKFNNSSTVQHNFNSTQCCYVSTVSTTPSVIYQCFFKQSERHLKSSSTLVKWFDLTLSSQQSFLMVAMGWMTVDFPGNISWKGSPLP